MPDLPEGLPELQFDSDQAAYDAWYTACVGKVDNKEFFYSDVNDGVLNFACLHYIAQRHPEKLDKIREICPQVVIDAMTKLGMAMGAANIAKHLELDAKEVQEIMFKRLFEHDVGTGG